jgi:PHD/YefM family antitoxin component YafN of YafNO toxin-antitoxin module
MAKVAAAAVQKNFGRYQDQALVAPVTVTKYGRPSVVIVSATEYQRLRKLDREALAVTELSARDITAIKAARIPKRRRYRSSDLA